MSVRKPGEPIRASCLSYDAGKLIQVRRKVGCYAFVVADSVRCINVVNDRNAFDGELSCGCTRHERISLKGGQIGMSIRYTQDKARYVVAGLSNDLVALFDEQLIVAFSDEFEDI